MGQKDMAEKIMEDYPDVFADIVNVLLFDGKQVISEEDLKETGMRSQFKADTGRIHEQEWDVGKYLSLIHICVGDINTTLTQGAVE